MRIFYFAALHSPKSAKVVTDVLKKICQEKGHSLIADHTQAKVEARLATLKHHQAVDHFKKILRELKKSDLMILEGTCSTTGGGHYLSIALQNYIPTLYLSQSEYIGPLLAEQNRLLKIGTYNPNYPKKLDNLISKFMTFALGKRLNIRFNLMISESIDSFLNSISKKNNLSKSDYVRNLIEEKIKNGV